ncbi:antirestriction protein ArdA [Hungatella hathewayi]
MKVTITADKYSGRRGYHSVYLQLPAERYEIEDALQRARVTENGGYTVSTRYGDWPIFLDLAFLSCGEMTLEELSLLASLVSRMDRGQLRAYEGIVTLRQEDFRHPISVKDLINAAYNIESYEFHPGVLNDYDLGVICIQGEMLDLISSLPDEVCELLDEEKVGAALRSSEQGIFTPQGYMYPSGEWHEVYDGVHLPEQPVSYDGSIAICMERSHCAFGMGENVWLELPAARTAIEEAVQFLGAASLDDCVITNLKSIVPILENQLYRYEDIIKLNTLAERIQAFDRKELVKYKAILQMECCDNLDQELDIANNLACYNYDTIIFSPESFSEYIFKEAGFDIDDPAFKGFDFARYGERCLRENGTISTSYGMITRNSRPFVHEYTTPQLSQTGMTMC